jgi:hypothetical protein
MAGIEPASEQLDPRTSTSVVRFLSRHSTKKEQKRRTASRLSPKALFRTTRDLLYGTSTL